MSSSFWVCPKCSAGVAYDLVGQHPLYCTGSNGVSVTKEKLLKALENSGMYHPRASYDKLRIKLLLEELGLE